MASSWPVIRPSSNTFFDVFSSKFIASIRTRSVFALVNFFGLLRLLFGVERRLAPLPAPRPRFASLEDHLSGL